MTRHYYAAHNTYADLRNGNHGFLNTWEVSRFPSREARDVFVDLYSDQLAKPVTRREAEGIWRGTYLCVGDTPPRGGLFATHDRWGWRLQGSRFWNEEQALYA